jgi:alpha-L-fucosidase 2
MLSVMRTTSQLFILVCLSAPLAAGSEAASTSAYDVVWDAPGKDSSGSMPVGNGDVGLNVWVEEDGDLLFYISKTDAWDENGRLVKLGRVRVGLSPNPFGKGVPFRQRLDLKHGQVEIRAGRPDAEVTVIVWVDAHRPVVHVEASAGRGIDARVTLEPWRTKERRLSGRELFSAYGLDGSPEPVIVRTDTVLPSKGNRITWFHRNPTSIWPVTMRLQGLEDWMPRACDPLLNRMFGGAIEGAGFASEDATTLKSEKARKSHVLAVHVLTARTATPEEWVQRLERQMAETGSADLERARAAHRASWGQFWDRSYIHLSGSRAADQISQAYALQRFISACAGRGAYPIKFNGSIFTVDAREKEERYDADYRRWGGPYWFQNTRLAYWPMLGSGDFEMMRPLFRMYLDALPLALHRTQVYFAHPGAFFPETMYFWGAYANDNYGWDRKGKPVSHVDNTYIRWYWSGALELTALMLDYFAYTQDAEFVRTTLLPFADAVFTFYDRHYARDERGRIVFKPAQALETWQDVINPLPEIAGLRFVIDGLQGLPTSLMTETFRAMLTRIRGELPELPSRQIDGKTILAPAEKVFGQIANSENPELYAVYPYRLFGVGKPDLEMARLTFAQRRFKGNSGWQQDDTQAAFLGLASEAAQRVAARFSSRHAGSRFPAFWGPNFDWTPDQDHGCNGLMALQTMLIQVDGHKILLFPAWPRGWDVTFRLHAPLQTTLEGVYSGGKVQKLTVAPESRTHDVVELEPQ